MMWLVGEVQVRELENLTALRLWGGIYVIQDWKTP
jgi:hypothetical protein